jgi:hypothetical protein
MVCVSKAIKDLEGVGINVAARQRVLGAWNDPRLRHRRALYQSGVFVALSRLFSNI